MNKQDMLKIQTCVLRVDIHCEGCKNKVKKKLKNVEGVYKVSIDEELGKVTVSGNVDPAILINKLEKGGKHAELWGAKRGPISILNNQFKNIQFGNTNGGKDGKTQNGGKDQSGIQAQMNQKKGLKDAGKDQKSVKFNLPEDEEDEEEYDDLDEFDEDEEDFDDEFDEGFGARQPPSKVAPVGHGHEAKRANSDGRGKGNSGAKNGGKAKKGGGIDMFLKGMLGKGGGKNKKQDDGSKNSKKNGGFAPGVGKNGSKNGKGGAHKSNGGGKSNDSWVKKVGDNFDGGPKFDSRHQGFNEMNANHKGGGGRNMDPMSQMGGFQAVQGLPAAAAMNAGRFQGAGQDNPYNQQYMAHMMMMMNQHGGNGYGAYHPLAYTRSQPAMSYGPHPPTDQYTHMFSDENTSSCSIM